MDKKVLFYSSQDTRTIFDFNQDYESAIFKLGFNSGNMVFTNAIQTYLHLNNTQYDITIRPEIVTEDGVNEKYGCCIVNCSNWLQPGSSSFLKKLTSIFEQSKVPVYFIGLGVQASTEDSFNSLDKEFIDVAHKFVASVLNSGGTIGLRGYYSGEFLEFLGFKDGYSVVGCPSMYQIGRQLQVNNNNKVSKAELNTVFNGSNILGIKDIETVLNSNRNSIFVDQDRFFKILMFSKSLNKYDVRALFNNQEFVLKLLREDRIKIFTNIKNWMKYLKQNNFNYSLGSRFHGSVVPILCGIPALILAHDKRVKELTDFFKIPVMDIPRESDSLDLYDSYLRTDYSNFNNNFKTVWDNFESFIIKNNLPLKLPDNQFIDISPNYEENCGISNDLGGGYRQVSQIQAVKRLAATVNKTQSISH